MKRKATNKGILKSIREVIQETQIETTHPMVDRVKCLTPIVGHHLNLHLGKQKLVGSLVGILRIYPLRL